MDLQKGNHDMRRFITTLGCVSLAFAASARAQSDGHLIIHGYLTQAYGTATGGTFLGIPDGGTANYGIGALQFRYALSPTQNMTVQLTNRRMGESPLTVGENDIRVDWAFYNQRFGNFDVKIGRVAIPAGIYNEIRDVGVVLPMYRVPFNFYLEGAYTSETVDGAVGSYTIGAGKPWSMDVSAFGGEWHITDRIQDDSVYVAKSTRATKAVGGQTWLNTPVDGLRFGFGASRYTTQVETVGGDWKEWHGSFDLSLDRVTAQSEIRHITFPDGSYEAHYVYLGVRPLHKLTISGMADFANVDLDLGPAVFALKWNAEYSIGASYAFAPNLVVKLEGHRAFGYQADLPALDPTAQPPALVKYALLSVSTSF
jgi:hypothetical protein